MRRPRYVEVRSLNDTLMLLLTGAIAGTAAGVYLGRRYGSVGALVDGVRNRLVDAWDSWNEDEELEAGDEYEDELLEDGEEHALPDEGAYDELEPEGVVGAPFDEEIDEPDDELDEELDDELDDELEPIAAADELPPRREADVADLPSAEPARRSLEARVLAGFRTDEVLGRRAIDIAAVGDGVIELTGWVRSGEEAARAAALARAVTGVEMVLNRMTVRGPEELAHESEAAGEDAGRASRSGTTPPAGGVVSRTPPEGLAP